MSRPILAAYDPQHSDRAPIRFAAAAARFTGARLVIATVHVGVRALALSAGQTLPYALAEADDNLVPDASDELREIRAELEAEGICADVLLLPGDSAAGPLHRAAEDLQAGLLVVGRGTAREGMLGSTAERLIHGARSPVAVVPPAWDSADGAGVRTIGVAFVDTEEGREALRGAYALACRIGGRLRVLTVVKPRLVMYAETEDVIPPRPGRDFDSVVGEHRVEAEAGARKAVAEVLGDDAEVEVDAFVGDPGDTLIDLSAYLDLLVSGSRGYGPVRAVLLGGVARRLATAGRCPVIVLPRGVEAPLEEQLLAEPPKASTGRSSA
jgi:nucleotide-binding universal stress UspA family protein